MITTTAYISLLAFNDKIRAQIDKRSLLDLTLRMSFYESFKKLYLQEDKNKTSSLLMLCKLNLEEVEGHVRR